MWQLQFVVICLSHSTFKDQIGTSAEATGTDRIHPLPRTKKTHREQWASQQSTVIPPTSARDRKPMTNQLIENSQGSHSTRRGYLGRVERNLNGGHGTEEHLQGSILERGSQTENCNQLTVLLKDLLQETGREKGFKNSPQITHRARNSAWTYQPKW